jgi:protocatechuate 3,4-dioxygenase beta subunit
VGTSSPASAAPTTSPAQPTGSPVAVGTAGAGAASTPAGTAVATTGAAGGATPAVANTAIAAVQSGQAAVPNCVLTTELTEGPYFVDEKLNRSDIRSDPSDSSVKPGTSLAISVRVLGVSGTSCAPVKGAQVDVWQCDASGVYSDAQDPGFNTKGKKFLRGYQVTDESGVAKFTTLYPGWYPGRATHIHFKIRTDPTTEKGREVTSQWFFDDTLNDQIYTSVAPYSTKGNNGRLKNSGDDIYKQSGGRTLLQLTKSGDAYTASFDVGIKLA